MNHLVKILLFICSFTLSAAELQVLYTLNPSALNAPTAIKYSQMKYGDPQATKSFAEQLVHRLASTLPVRKGEWGVLTVTGMSAPTASTKLAAEVAHLLNFPLIPVQCSSTPAVSYSSLSCGTRRAALVKGRFSVPDQLPEHVIFVDDAVASGAHVREFTRLIEDRGSKIHPIVIYQIPPHNLSLENQLNEAAINPTKLGVIIDQPDHPILVRTMKTALSFTAEHFDQMLSEIRDSRLIEFYNAITREGLDLASTYRENLRHLNQRVNQASRSRKALDLPAYESLLLIQESNAEALLAKEGQLYSKLKYGDIQVIDSYADRIVQRIRLHYGDQIHSESHLWSVASAGYYRTPNAASFLADRIAEKLGLDRVDLRARGIFAGEFGIVADPKEREKIVANKLYVSNPQKVQARHVLYIDDVYVSGAHLIEHQRLLEEAGALEVLPYAVLDVASRDLTLEKALNYAIAAQSDQSALLDVIKNRQNPVLTRAAKLVLRLSDQELYSFMHELEDERLFALLEASEAEGYGKQAVFENAFNLLTEEAHRRHANRPTAQEPRLLLLDYDGTLAEVLSPLQPPMMDAMLNLLEKGAQIAIVTMQPLGERGIQEFTLDPLIAYMAQQGKDLSLLKGLHLFPCGGMEYYRVQPNGEVNESDPVYNAGLQLWEKRWLENLVTDQVGHLASNMYFRKGYVSTHYPNETCRQEAKQILDQELRAHLRLGTVVHQRPWVMHVRVKDLSKVVARSYIMQHLRNGCDRSEILVAGDRMGPGESDSEMFVYGATNLAVGKLSCPGSVRYPEGLLDFLQKLLLQSTSTL